MKKRNCPSCEGQKVTGSRKAKGTAMARKIKYMTYHNLMAVIRKIQAKGYDFETSERLARSVFTEYAATPQGLTIEQRIERILDYEEWVRQ